MLFIAPNCNLNNYNLRPNPNLDLDLEGNLWIFRGCCKTKEELSLSGLESMRVTCASQCIVFLTPLVSSLKWQGVAMATELDRGFQIARH